MAKKKSKINKKRPAAAAKRPIAKVQGRPVRKPRPAANARPVKPAGIKPKKKKNQKRRKVPVAFFRFLFVVLVLAGLWFANHFFCTNPAFAVKDAEIIGTEDIAKATILDLGGISLGETNIFALDSVDAEEKIETHYLVSKADVRKHFFSRTLTITITECQPWALVTVQDKQIVVDSNGIYIQDADKVEDTSDLLLVSIDDSYNEHLNFGDSVCPEGMQIIQRLNFVMTPDVCKQSFSEYHYNYRKKSLVLYTTMGTEIIFGDLDNLETKVQKIYDIQAAEKNYTMTGGVRKTTYNLMYKNQVITD